MRYLVATGLVAAIAGCSDAKPDATPANPPSAAPVSQPGPPPTPKPTLGNVNTGPPAAWLETQRGSVWLGYSSYCWTMDGQGVCADFIAPSCADPEHTPKIPLRRGERVTAHIDFDPAEVALSFFPAQGAPTAADQRTLKLSRTPSWVVERDGPFSLFVRAKGGGDASYVACAHFN
jgi:hypothetical protein